jgi:hypothetical protein
MAPRDGVAPLSFKSQVGYYGLRVNPTFDQVLGTVRKPLRIPLPERREKWYALGPYRSLILDANELAMGYDRRAIEYDLAAGRLPQYAARLRPSEAGLDPTFDRYDHEHAARHEQDAYEHAFDLMNAEHQQDAAHIRREQLRRGYGPNRMHPVIEASHDELDEAGVRHYMPAPRQPPPRRGWPATHGAEVAYGQPQAPEFPDFRVLNMGDPRRVDYSVLRPDELMGYERMRDLAAARTWSS